MMLTEADARRKWCPFGRTLLGAGRVANDTKEFSEVQKRDQTKDSETFTRCIASGCMMWRNAESAFQEVKGIAHFIEDKGQSFEKLTPPILEKAAANAMAQGYEPFGHLHLGHFLTFGKNPTNTGFCGLAGGPK